MALEQPLAELRHAGADRAHAGEHAGARGEEVRDRAPRVRERGLDRGVRRPGGREGRDPEARPEHRHYEERRAEEDLRGEVEPDRLTEQGAALSARAPRTAPVPRSGRGHGPPAPRYSTAAHRAPGRSSGSRPRLRETAPS